MEFTLLKTVYAALFWCRELTALFLNYNDERQEITVNNIILREYMIIRNDGCLYNSNASN
jgi:hypothetical protein